MDQAKNVLFGEGTFLKHSSAKLELTEAVSRYRGFISSTPTRGSTIQHFHTEPLA